MSDFSLAFMANVYIFITAPDFCLLPAQFCYMILLSLSGLQARQFQTDDSLRQKQCAE
jgi:hypothetical protein